MKKFLSVFLFTCYLNAQWGGWGSNSTPDWGGNTTVDDGGGVTPIDCEWIVTNTNDSGTGSLRQMISDASSGDTICFDPSLYGETIHLSTGALEINKSLTILGYPFANIIISADSLSRVIETTSGSPTIILRNLRITKGLYDGTAVRGW